MKKLWKELSKKVRGFTLIELLIVIGILGVLAVAVLLAINPAEAQRKARDTKRMKDLGTLQSAVDQYVAANNPPAANMSVNSTGNSASVNCAATGWTTINLCPYLQTVPIDPINSAAARQAAGATGATACPTTTSSTTNIYYRLYIDTTNQYEINVRQESPSNCTNLASDGGNSNYWAEEGTSFTLLGD